ncbi:MAG: hypothetical protein RB292_03865 [Patescibacteria group bacterium]|nr:hypothetical protein [Patescibacteria group bacterium]
MNDAYVRFKALTGLEWYPEPHAIANDAVAKQAVDLVDGIIAAQAKALGMSHLAAQEAAENELAQQAEAEYLQFCIWLAQLAN